MRKVHISKRFNHQPTKENETNLSKITEKIAQNPPNIPASSSYSWPSADNIKSFVSSMFTRNSLAKASTRVYQDKYAKEGDTLKKKTKFFSGPRREDLLNRTAAIVGKLKTAESNVSRILRIKELNSHLIQYPQCTSIAWSYKLPPLILKMQQTCTDDTLQHQLAEATALLGIIDPVDGRGIRILSIDGGGTRGLMVLEILSEMLQLCKPGTQIHELFDYIVGVSTGALIAALIGGLQLSIDQCKEIYREVSLKLFAQGRVAGSIGLLRRHSFYDTEQWTSILQRTFGETRLMDTVHDRLRWPKIGIISCVGEPKLEPFIFRNYAYHPDSQSIYPGDVNFFIWQALRASAAAPGYFEECKLGNYVHQDGGVLANNPTALGIHESRVLWPTTPIHCVVSMGTGRMAHLPQQPPSKPAQYSSTIDKLLHVVNSATDTEKTHTLLHDLFEPGSYYRFNPYMSRRFTLDEASADSVEQMTADAKVYVRKNQAKVQDAVERLTMRKNLTDRFRDRLSRRFY